MKSALGFIAVNAAAGAALALIDQTKLTPRDQVTVIIVAVLGLFMFAVISAVVSGANSALEKAGE